MSVITQTALCNSTVCPRRVSKLLLPHLKVLEPLDVSLKQEDDSLPIHFESVAEYTQLMTQQNSGLGNFTALNYFNLLPS